MQHPKLIVLGLIAQGMNYGLAMEQFIQKTNMRDWAEIGGSTIYKVLRDLEKEGALTVEKREGARGPGKNVYKLTSSGRAELGRLVGQALASRESVYSDRIVGLFFALSLPRQKARKAVGEAAEGLAGAIAETRTQKEKQDHDPIAEIILDFYETVYAAEQRALRAMEDFLDA